MSELTIDQKIEIFKTAIEYSKRVDGPVNSKDFSIRLISARYVLLQNVFRDGLNILSDRDPLDMVPDKKEYETPKCDTLSIIALCVSFLTLVLVLIQALLK